MNTPQVPSKTMTLKEITDLLDVRHDNAFKKVKKMSESDGFGTVFEIDIVYNDKGQKLKTFQLDKRQSIAVASLLDTTLLMRVIDRWQELEANQAPALPQSFSEALQLAANQAKQLEDQAPKIKVYERLADRKDNVSTTVLAKNLGTTAQKLNIWFKKKGIKFMHADLPKAGYELWFNVVSDAKNGHGFQQCLITPKGQIEIAKRFEV